MCVGDMTRDRARDAGLASENSVFRVHFHIE